MDIGQERGAEEGAAPAGKGWRGGGFEPGWGREREPGRTEGRGRSGGPKGSGLERARCGRGGGGGAGGLRGSGEAAAGGEAPAGTGRCAPGRATGPGPGPEGEAFCWPLAAPFCPVPASAGRWEPQVGVQRDSGGLSTASGLIST